MTPPLRVGIVGCGEVAQIIHLPTLRDLRDHFAVTALCDVSPRVLVGVGEEWRVAARHRDHRDLVTDPDVDVVLIANPHVLHHRVAVDAMRAGKHVFIEKPMCMTLAEADDLLEVEAETGVTAQVGYMRRYAPAFIEAVRLVRGMKTITLARVHDVIGRNALIIQHVSNTIRGTDLAEADAAALRAAMAAKVTEAIGPAPQILQNAYGLLLGLSSHDLSAMREILGYPRKVLFAAARGPEGRGITAAFDYGGYVCLFSTGIDGVPRFDAHIEVYSPDRTVRVDYDTPYVRNIPGALTVTEAGGEGETRTSGGFSWQDFFSLEWRAFHDNVARRQKPKTSIADAREDLTLFAEMIGRMRDSLA